MGFKTTCTTDLTKRRIGPHKKISLSRYYEKRLRYNELIISLLREKISLLRLRDLIITRLLTLNYDLFILLLQEKIVLLREKRS